MSHPPDKKQQRYDRQLRLWGAHGQAALESSHVLLINGNATGAEILKNLVLPGIASFTILDPSPVLPSDLGSNFFVDPEDIGKPRAKVVAERLREMNEDVAGEWVGESPSTLLSTNPSFFLRFHLVVLCNHNSPGPSSSASSTPPVGSSTPSPSTPTPQSTSGLLSEKEVAALEDLLWERNVPLVMVRSYGLAGMVRVGRKEHRVIDPHTPTPDLRLQTPFPALQALVDSVNLDALDDHARTGVPFVVILCKAMEKWKKENPTTPPTASALKKLVLAMSKDLNREENFVEASGQAYRACGKYEIPRTARNVLEDPECDKVGVVGAPPPHPFWIVARAVRDFAREEGAGYLPHPGSVPDMKADTGKYVELATIYRQKHLSDLASIRTRVASVVSQINSLPRSTSTSSIDSAPPPAVGETREWAGSVQVKDEEIERWCKNASQVVVKRYKRVKDELGEAGVEAGEPARHLSQPDSPFLHYVLLRAVDRFRDVHHRFPGVLADEVEPDIRLLKKQVQELLKGWGSQGVTVPDEYVHETVRCGAAELHAIAALIGGIASQECIKLITGQYVPVVDTFVFDGIKSVGGVYEL
ncbi:Nedd8 activating enzyme E1 subunit 1 [Gonapodya prolifera JEL478]|uniref:NEDD8-activating enzyme E1 regulatory subunit n=1 Tax=Gonapodya prolifera (strain JEL478) TaxID=1344416 RepID=A0A139ABZ5_GONPJ|nr:Nedd8 activating enzyme E1 subunit 1 [Gonapodya prolifera JEL478]|eukprot:KXS14290.1 Nedd8 activating enzyme E1 subunit 1 [Gonapodya prolifera JEL478]